MIGLLCDAGSPPPLDIVDSIEEELGNLVPLVAAQARRARGLLLAKPDELAAAEALYASLGAEPDAARARLELGRLVGDEERVDTATGVLEQLGDLHYLAGAGRD